MTDNSGDKVTQIHDRLRKRMAEKGPTEANKKALEGIQLGREGKKVVILLPRAVNRMAFSVEEAIAFADAIHNSAALIVGVKPSDPNAA